MPDGVKKKKPVTKTADDVDVSDDNNQIKFLVAVSACVVVILVQIVFAFL